MFCSNDCKFMGFVHPRPLPSDHLCLVTGVVSTCPPRFDGWQLKDDCESGNNAWVYYRDTSDQLSAIRNPQLSAVYKNSHCAICNMDDNITNASLERDVHYESTLPEEDFEDCRFINLWFQLNKGSCHFNRDETYGWDATVNVNGRLGWNNFTLNSSSGQHVYYEFPLNFGETISDNTIKLFSWSFCGDSFEAPIWYPGAKIIGGTKHFLLIPSEIHNSDQQVPIEQLFGYNIISATVADDMKKANNDWRSTTGITKICANALYTDDGNGATYTHMRLSSQGIEVS